MKEVTQKDIDRAIKNCTLADKHFKGKDRTHRYVVCKGECLPCLAVIEKGTCDTLKELFAKGGATS